MAKQTFTTGQVLTAAQMTSLQQTAMGGGSTTAKTASYVLVAADAGTVVQMNSASSTTITVNTSLFSAGDTVFIQNVGAGVCTVTAGTATVSTAGSLALSQYEGGTLYFNSASASIFFDIVQSTGMTNPMTTTGDTIYSSSGTTPARLGIGTTGQVLTVASGVPSWATPSGSGGLTYITKQTAADVANLTFDSVFTSTYQNYLIVYDGVRSTTSAVTADLYFQFRYAGPTTQAATYQYGLTGTSSSSTAINVGATGQSQAILSQYMGNSGYRTQGQLFLTGVGDGASGFSFGTGQNVDSYGEQYINYGFAQTTQRAYTGFIITASSGNFNGTFTLYGLAKS